MRHDIPKRFPVAKTYRDGTPVRDGYGSAPDEVAVRRAIASGGSSRSSRLPDPIQTAKDAIEGRRA